MPVRSSAWIIRAFWTPEQMRAEGLKWDEIAVEAELDGDRDDAKRCRVEAATFRQMAREKAADLRAAQDGGKP